MGSCSGNCIFPLPVASFDASAGYFQTSKRSESAANQICLLHLNFRGQAPIDIEVYWLYHLYSYSQKHIMLESFLGYSSISCNSATRLSHSTFSSCNSATCNLFMFRSMFLFAVLRLRLRLLPPLLVLDCKEDMERRELDMHLMYVKLSSLAYIPNNFTCCDKQKMAHHISHPHW